MLLELLIEFVESVKPVIKGVLFFEQQKLIELTKTA